MPGSQAPQQAGVAADVAADGAADVAVDVAIVGCGPTGAMAAALLAQAGLSVWVGDRALEVYDKPRAIAMDHEVLRLFQQLGLSEAVARWTEPFTPSEYFGVQGQLIKRLTMLAQPWPLGHTPSMVFSQPPVERLLRDHLAKQPGMQLALGSTLLAMQQDSNGVSLQCQSHDGSAHSVRASWLIGCDGASSTVRQLAGLALDDLDFDEPWLVVDVLVNAQGLAKLPSTSVQYCEPDRPCTLVIGPGNHRRWEISLQPGEDPAQAATPEGTWALLSRWLTPQDGTLWRQASYRFHALVATQWRSGRVFIAGDAAHQQPPFLGQGMCQGQRDAANLAWKLAAVHQGRAQGTAAQRLLDSYGEERQGHVRALTQRIKAIGAVICERDRARAQARDAQLLADCGGVVPDSPRQDLMPALASGCLSAQPSSARGTVFPQPRLQPDTGTNTGPLLDAHAGPGWWLVSDAVLAAAAADLPQPPALQLRLLHIGPQGLAEADGVLANWLRQHACHAALVRPDRCVFGTAASAQALGMLLAEAAGWFNDPAPTTTPASTPASTPAAALTDSLGR